MRQHPSRWDVVNPRRAWFKELSRHVGISSWHDYLVRYTSARHIFNAYIKAGEITAAFADTKWCLYRQPFRHRWTRWNHVLAHMPANEWGAILDYGCGTGEMLAWLRERRPTWLCDGHDLPSPQLNYARRRGFDYPRLTHRYDIVTCYETLEHVPDPVQAVEEMLGYLRPDGVLLWDFIDDYEGGNVATREGRREVLQMLNGTTGQRECYVQRA